MITLRAGSPRCAAIFLLGLTFPIAPMAWSCEMTTKTKVATPAEIRAFFAGKRMTVLTFLGYSGAEYEDGARMIDQATRVIDQFDPGTTIVNTGATAEGIGAIYEVAKRKGYQTSGIVSTQAKENNVALSSCVDVVFYVPDATWGGKQPGTEVLSPTSTAMVENSDMLVAIGGGQIARDELIAARRAGKRVQFIPADMNHEIARDKALKNGQPVPTDFRGAAGTAFE